MKNTVITVMMIYGIAALIMLGCAQNNGRSRNNGGSNPNPSATPRICQSGQIYQGGQCITPVNPIQQNSPQHFKMWVGNSNQSTRPTSTSGLTKFLKEASCICDQLSWANGGIASCDTWAQGDMLIAIDVPNAKPSSALVTFTTYPAASWYSYSFGLPTASQYCNPFPTSCAYVGGYLACSLSLRLNAGAINNSEGYRVVGYGPYGSPAYNKEVIFEFEDGAWTDNQLDISFKYNGSTIAIGRATRNY